MKNNHGLNGTHIFFGHINVQHVARKKIDIVQQRGFRKMSRKEKREDFSKLYECDVHDVQKKR